MTHPDCTPETLEELAERCRMAGAHDIANTADMHARQWRDEQREAAAAQQDNTRLQQQQNIAARALNPAA